MLYLQLLLPRVFLPMFWKFVTGGQTNKPTFLPQWLPLFYVESQLSLDTTTINHHLSPCETCSDKTTWPQTWSYILMSTQFSINTGCVAVESHSWSLTVIFTPWFSSPLHGSFCAMIMTVWFLSGPWLLLVMCSHLDSLVSVNTMTNITGQLEGRSMGTLLKIQEGFIMDYCF